MVGAKAEEGSAQGGAPITICAKVAGHGASWGSDDRIVFAQEGGGLWRVPASGGEPERITELDRETREVSHRLPHVLPGAKAVLFTVLRHQTVPVNWDKAQIFVQLLETGERKLLIEGGSDARYVPTGHLVYAREGTLMAAPFDLETLTINRLPVPVLEGVSHSIYTGNSTALTGAAQFTFSDSGSLAYIAGPIFPEPQQELVWVNRKGDVDPIDLEPGWWVAARLSPEGTRVALSRWYQGTSLWIYDLVRETLSVQISEGHSGNPVWAPDGF